MAHRRDLQIASLIENIIRQYFYTRSCHKEITIIQVTMQDKKTALISYEPLEKNISYDNLLKIQAELDKLTPRLRHHIAKETAMKATPHIRFSPSLESSSGL